MSDVLTGNFANVTSPLSATVTALANNGSGAARATTSSPHLFGTSDVVNINAPPIIGTYPITVIDSTHFDLIGSTYTATGTGTVTDTSITPQVQVPTDGDTFSAQLSGLLSSFQALLDRTQYLQLQFAGVSSSSTALQTAQVASNWSVPSVVDISATYVQGNLYGGPEWDTAGLQWMVPAIKAGTTSVQIYVSSDGLDTAGGTWERLGALDLVSFGAGPTQVSAGYDPNNAAIKYMASVGPFSGGVGGVISRGSAGSWSGGSTLGTHSVTDIQCSAFGSYAIFAVGSASAGDVEFVYTNNSGVSYSTSAVGQAVSYWILRQNGTVWIAAPRDQTFATPFVYTSTDGHTFVQQTAGFGGNLVATDSIVGLDWGSDAIGPCWIMAVHRSGSAVKFLRSTDGINWTMQNTGVGAMNNLRSLAAVGRAWIGVVVPSSTIPAFIVYSSDGGVTWYRSEAQLQQPSVGNLPTFVRSNGKQACVSSIIGARFTQIQGAAAGPLV